MILPLYASIERLDPRAARGRRPTSARAASRRSSGRDAAAHAARACSPAASSCSCPSMGNFVIPELLGGGKTRHGRQPDPRPVPQGARLAVRRGARAVRRRASWSALFALQALGDAGAITTAVPREPARARARLARGCPLWLTYVFLYLPIARARGHVVQRAPRRPTRWTGFSTALVRRAVRRHERSARALVNTLIVAVGRDRDRDRARHAARDRAGPLHPVDARWRRCVDGAGDPARPRAGDRAARLLRADRDDARAALGAARARGLRDGVRRRRRARPARPHRPVASRRPRRDLGAGRSAPSSASRCPRSRRRIVAGALLAFTLSTRRVRDRLLHQRPDHARPCPSSSTRWSASASPPRSTPWPTLLLLVSFAVVIAAPAASPELHG